jgi:uncharacterized RDD family membrane protein YckC
MIDDTYGLRTPEQIDLQYDLAGIGSRFLAMLIDSVIQSVVALAVLFVFVLGALLLSGTSRDWFGADFGIAAFIGIAVALLLTFLLTWGYFIFFELAWNGQTPGKRVAGIRVLTDRGEPVTLVHALVRNVLRLVDMLPSAYMIGAICILMTRRSQRLGDLAAGTVVVRERRAELPRTLPPLDPSLMLPPQLAQAFTMDDVLLARDFVLRAPDLQPVQRYELAARIAASLRARLAASGQPAPPDLPDERLVLGVAALRA